MTAPTTPRWTPDQINTFVTMRAEGVTYTRMSHPSIAEIQHAVCKHFGVREIEMLSARRGWAVSHPRQLAMYLARELTPHSLPVIGKHFGNRDHTTVMHAIKVVEARIASDPVLAATANALRRGAGDKTHQNTVKSEFEAA